MCIIVAKKKGVKMPSRETFKECFRANSDGAGFMYNYKGSVVIQKGFMTYKDFDSALTKVEKKLKNIRKHGMVFHFRITTQGGTNPMNCHPFPISREDNDLQQTYIETDLGVAHNGIIDLTTSSYSYNSVTKSYNWKDDKLSDTQLFIRDYMTDIKELNPDFYLMESGLNLVETLIDSKMAFLDFNGTITTIGSFNVSDDVLYSNYSYEVRKYSKHTTALLNDNYYEDYYGKYDADYPKLKLMPIKEDGYYWNSEEQGEIEANNNALDNFGYLYEIDTKTKECQMISRRYVEVCDKSGVEIDFDSKYAEMFTDIDMLFI